MKPLLLSLSLFLLASPAVAVELPKDVSVVDLTGKNFEDTSLNMMSDGMEDYPGGYVLMIEGDDDGDFSIKAEASNPKETCDVSFVGYDGYNSYFHIEQETDVDSGETCTLTIERATGEKAVVTVYTEGT